MRFACGWPSFAWAAIDFSFRSSPIFSASIPPANAAAALAALKIMREEPERVQAVIDRVVDVHIGKLRQKIETDPSAPRHILTVRGVGYKFAERPPQDPGSPR